MTCKKRDSMFTSMFSNLYADSGEQALASDRGFNTESSESDRTPTSRQSSTATEETSMVVPQHHPNTNTHSHSSESPVYIPEDISIPSAFDLKESQTYDGKCSLVHPLDSKL